MIPKNAFAVSVVARASSFALSPRALMTARRTQGRSGHTAVVEAYDRMRAAGLPRHSAVHALASVAAQHLVSVLGRGSPLDQTTADLDYAALDPAAFKPKPKR